MKARIILELDLTDDGGSPLNQARTLDALDETEAAIRNRLFGEGFLPDDVNVESYDVKKELVA